MSELSIPRPLASVSMCTEKTVQYALPVTTLRLLDEHVMQTLQTGWCDVTGKKSKPQRIDKERTKNDRTYVCMGFTCF